MNSSIDGEHMIKPTAPQTYKILREILLRKDFTQREISRDLKVSLGQVNKVVNWLEDKKYISHPGIKYKLEQPIAILNLFTLFRKMDDCKTVSLKLNISEKEIKNYLKGNKADMTFCLTSALGYYSAYFRDPSVNFYTLKKEIINELASVAKSQSVDSTPNAIIVNIYKPDLSLEFDWVTKPNRVTSDFRTVLDLFCDGKAYAAKDLIKDLWGVDFG